MKRFAANLLLWQCAAVLAPVLLLGCGQGASSPTLAIAGQSMSPRERLNQLAERYRDAVHYQDAGELRFLVDGAPEEEFRSLPFSVALERPNKLRIHALDTTSVADGEHLQSTVQSLPGQVLMRACPDQMTLEALMADEMLADAMRGQLQVDMPQLLLLTAAQPLEVLTRDSTPKQLSDSEFLGQKCWRIALEGPAGKAVMWIEQQSGLLVKYEFPLEEVRKRFPLAKLWAEFRGASTTTEINPVAFKFERPDEAKLVRQFIMPPPTAPHPMLGKPVEEYTFIGLDGTALGNQSLAGKVVVLDMWATWCGWCFEGLPLLDRVYKEYQDNEDLSFLAVSKDDLSVANSAVAEAFEKAKLSLPIVRDQEQITDRVFQVEGLPTTILLGRDGTIQDYHIGYDPNLPQTLPAKLEKLLAGENLAQQAIDAYEQQKLEFEARLSEVLVEADGNGEETAAAPAEEPELSPEVAREAGPSFD